MKRKMRRRTIVSEINITPFTDVILVLLIIFMVITPLMSKVSVKVSLPEVIHTESETSKNITYITVGTDGKLYLNDELVAKESLKESVGQLQRSGAPVNVVLLSDRTAKFQDIVGVLDVLVDAGIKNLSIGATPKRSAEN